MNMTKLKERSPGAHWFLAGVADYVQGVDRRAPEHNSTAEEFAEAQEAYNAGQRSAALDLSRGRCNSRSPHP